MNLEENMIWNLIKNHIGSSDAVQVKVLSQATSIHPRYVRLIVKSLIETHHKPIGSTVNRPAGYYCIVDDIERKAVRASLYRRALSILRRARAYEPERSKWVSQLIGQLELLQEK